MLMASLAIVSGATARIAQVNSIFGVTIGWRSSGRW